MSTDGGIQKNQPVYQWKQHPFSSFSVGIKSFITGKTIENIVVIETKYSIFVDSLGKQIYNFIEKKVAIETKYSIEEINYGKKSIFG